MTAPRKSGLAAAGRQSKKAPLTTVAVSDPPLNCGRDISPVAAFSQDVIPGAGLSPAGHREGRRQ